MKERSKIQPPKKTGGAEDHRWTFLSNHAHVLICLARDPDLRLRDLSQLIGITERAVLNILSDLEAEGIVRRHREGRRNSYELHLDHPLRHPIEGHHDVGELVRLMLG
jgi:DNA-binding transcriptional ArsR family regulator